MKQHPTILIWDALEIELSQNALEKYLMLLLTKHLKKNLFATWFILLMLQVAFLKTGPGKSEIKHLKKVKKYSIIVM